MSIINFPQLCPPVFWLFAIAWSFFQAFAGYHYGLYICDSAYKPLASKPSKCVRQVAYGIIHGAFYFILTFLGFLAWDHALSLSSSIDHCSTVSGGMETFLITLAVFSVLGVSGALPRILYLGKRPV